MAAGLTRRSADPDGMVHREDVAESPPLRNGDFMGQTERQVVLYKRWRLRPGVTIDDVAALVSDCVAPHYRKLSEEAALALEKLDESTVLAIQRWPDRASLDAAMRGDRFQEWWRTYLPVLAEWDAALDFEDEWESEVLLC